MTTLLCSLCRAPLTRSFVDLGMCPLVSAYVHPEKSLATEIFHPLHAFVCESCFHVQLPPTATPAELFESYPYFSSYSDSWLKHARRFAEEICGECGLGNRHRVIEVASNDGYLLQYFQQRGLSVLGVEPAHNVAAVARAAGIPTVTAFFGSRTAEDLVSQGHRADLLVGNNVLAHVPDPGDFTRGLRTLLAEDGTLTLEFPHLLRLLADIQFDTIFHEHASYLSLLTVRTILERQGFTIFDVRELETHGGSLRIYARHAGAHGASIHDRVETLCRHEREAGLRRIETYVDFGARVGRVKRELLEFVLQARRGGSKLAAYGAAGKGCVLLNTCGLGRDLVDYVVDRSPHKQDLLMPGVRVPIVAPERIAETRPDYLLILPWNLKQEIMQQMAFIRDWGGRFIVPLPRLEVL